MRRLLPITLIMRERAPFYPPCSCRLSLTIIKCTYLYYSSYHNLSSSGTTSAPSSSVSSFHSTLSPIFKLYSVMDAETFVETTRRQARTMVRYLQNELVVNDGSAYFFKGINESPLASSSTVLVNSTPSCHFRDLPRATQHQILHDIETEWLPLTKFFSIHEVEHEVWEVHKLKQELLSTCLVPYAIAKEMVVSRMPPKYKEISIMELNNDEEVRLYNLHVRRESGEKKIQCGYGEQKREDESGNLITSSIPKVEPRKLHMKPIPRNNIIQWIDPDMYGTAKWMSEGSYKRTPIFTLMGHIDHGKTTLLDTLLGRSSATTAGAGNVTSPQAAIMSSSGCDEMEGVLCSREAGKITQSIRAFTLSMSDCFEVVKNKQMRIKMSGSLVSDNDNISTHHLPPLIESEVRNPIIPPRAEYPTDFTVIDTPGHKVFAEMRLHSQLLTDVILLLIALDEGVLGQTIEIVHVALNADRPIVVLFNKIDKYLTQGEHYKLAVAIARVLKQLEAEGLDVTMITSMNEVEEFFKSDRHSCQTSDEILSHQKGVNYSVAYPYFLRKKQLNAERKKWKEIKKREKERGGTSISAKNGQHSSSHKLEEPPMTTIIATEQVVGANVTKNNKIKKNKSKQFKRRGNKTSSAAPIQGSLEDPILESGKLRRKCVGVCISGRDGTNIDILLEIMKKGAIIMSPMASVTTEASPKANNKPNNILSTPELDVFSQQHQVRVQAQVIEASKIVSGCSGELQELGKVAGGTAGSNNGKFRRIPRKMQSNLDKSLQKQLSSQGGSMMNAASRSLDNYSSNTNIIYVIVRSGVLVPGMHFVADQAVGRVSMLTNYWGEPMAKANPGMAAVVIDKRCKSGCPGVGTHVLEVRGSSSSTAQEEAQKIHRYRRWLQWFVEAFPTKTALLRPKGMDVRFRALGNFGQMERKAEEKSLPYKLLYGGGGMTVNSSNSADEKAAVTSLSSSCALPKDNSSSLSGGTVKGSGSLDGDSTTIQQPHRDTFTQEAICPSVIVAGTPPAIEMKWSTLQPEKLPETEEEMKKLQEEGTVIGIFAKVDSWHSARILAREIPRLSTSRVFFHLMGIRFGEIVDDDMMSFLSNSKIIVAYRVPKQKSSQVWQYIEKNNLHLIETDLYSDIVTSLKEVAINEHVKHLAMRGSDESRRMQMKTKVIVENIGIPTERKKRRGAQALTKLP